MVAHLLTYTIGSVSNTGGRPVGGVLGLNQDSTFHDSFWDPVTSGQLEAASPGGGSGGMIAGPMNAGPGSVSGVTALPTPMASDFTGAGWTTPPWQIPASGWPTLQRPATSVWTPPALTVDGVSGDVIGNWGYNPAVAVDNGTYFGYIEERAAVEAGTMFSGEGTNSSYLPAILDGSVVGLQQHVSAVQQGQFAALYQKLAIIPTWTNNAVSIPQAWEPWPKQEFPRWPSKITWYSSTVSCGRRRRRQPLRGF